MKRPMRVIYVLIPLFFFVSIFFFYSCGKDEVKIYTAIDSSGRANYKTFIAQKGIPQFSFEYSSNYELVSYHYMPDVPSTGVILAGSSAGEELGNIKHFEIHINNYSKDAEDELNWRIDDYKSSVKADLIKDLKIREKNRAAVAVAEGWEIIVSFTETGTPIHGMDDLTVREDPMPIVCRNLFFEYQNMVWEIFSYSDAATEEQAKADYEHIIRTLKFLE